MGSTYVSILRSKTSTSLPHHRELAISDPPSLSNKGTLQEELHHQRGWGYKKCQSNPGFLPNSLCLLGSWHFKCSAQTREPYSSVFHDAKYPCTAPPLDCTLSVLEMTFHRFYCSGKSSVKLQNMLTFLPCYSKKV